MATNKVKAQEIERKAELDTIKQRLTSQIEHTEALDELEISTQRELAAIEVDKFKETIEAIG